MPAAMTAIAVRPLRDDLPFGARITGLDWTCVKDEATRQHVRDVFEERGMIVFEGMEPSNTLQVEVSSIFGPMQEYTIKNVPKIEEEGATGMIDLAFERGDTTVFEIDGRQVAGWVNWHFDACYVARLNRGGVLRLTDIPPERGNTGFADGVQIWNSLSPEWRAKAEGLSVVYHEALMMHRQRFGMPESWKLVTAQPLLAKLFEEAEAKPRAVHPAVWTRPSGEKVVHIAPWQAAGIEGREGPDGDALLAGLWREVTRVMQPYWHQWKPTDMAIWDNWRFIHSVSGHDPRYSRMARRSTIAGDYGLGRLEGEPAPAAA